MIETKRSIPPAMYAGGADALLQNPDRGLRMEAHITVGDPLSAYPKTKYDPYEVLDYIVQKYAVDSPKVVQVYLYLSNYCTRPLDELAFSQIQKYMERCRKHRLRMLLRIAYATDETRDASYKWVSRHLSQLQEWVAAHSILVRDTVYCLQGGIAGLWGEGHSTRHFRMRHVGDAYQKLLDAFPADIQMQTRTMDLSLQVPEVYRPRLGMHHDYMIGQKTHPWSYFPTKDSPALQAERKRIRTTLNDGEMPWGCATMDDNAEGKPLNQLDGKAVLRECAAYALTTFSLEHNYQEDRKFVSESGTTKNQPYSMKRWQTQYLTPTELDNLKLPYNPNLFYHPNGNPVKISIYEYLRQHLGYHLFISDVNLQNRMLHFSLTNFGMAPPLTMHYLGIVLGKNRLSIPVSLYRRTALLPMKPVQYIVPLPDQTDLNAPIGLCMATQEGSAHTVRFANDTPCENGIQLIYNY